jgi:hypothetical protein
VQKNILEFPEGCTDDQKLDLLFKLHGIKKFVKIDEEDKPMIALALNQNDINSVEVDDEGGLVIGYSGDGWEKVDE